MHVIATAGHVDHGKSTLVHALTGMQPDRWAEERRRGLTIDLGFAWTELTNGQPVAFVDVPGHERFVPNMLAGVGPAPAALLVVAADEGWMPQSAEHLAALDALGVRHGILAITRSDLADPAPATAQARAALADTSLSAAETVALSARHGTGMDALEAALQRLVASLPPPEVAVPVRLWIDRTFTIRGSGTVVTGTLGAGQLHVGDELELAGPGGKVEIRGLQTLGRACPQVAAVARVAVNLRGMARDQLRRGDALVTYNSFQATDLVDVRITGDPVSGLPPTATLHIGSAALTVQIRPLGDDTARLRLPRAIPLHIGDRALLRDPGRHHIAGAVTVLDVMPPPLARRGAATQRAAALAGLDGRPDAVSELARRRLVRRHELLRMGVPTTGAAVTGDWLADPGWWREQRTLLRQHVAAHLRANPLASGVPTEQLRRALALPERQLVEALVQPPLVADGGLISEPSIDPTAALPEPVLTALAQLRADFAQRPFQAPPAHRLTQLGLGMRELAAVARVGALTRLSDAVVLPPDAAHRAAKILGRLPQPFTLSHARQALDTTRRVAVPLLELLDRKAVTRRLPDDRRTVVDCDSAPG